MGCAQRGHRAAGAGAELLMRLTFMTGPDFNATKNDASQRLATEWQAVRVDRVMRGGKSFCEVS